MAITPFAITAGHEDVFMLQSAISAKLREYLATDARLFIDGEWRTPHSDKRLDVIDPSTETAIAQIADSDAQDVDNAVAAARRAFDEGRWSKLSGYTRGEMLMRLATLLERDADAFAEIESVDNGKTRFMAGIVDIPASVTTLKQAAGWASRISGETLEPAGFFGPGALFHTYTRREPVGVCALIVPWNFPLLMALGKLGAALAAGCTVILKPAEQTSLTALRFADLVIEAGIPAGVINIITGRGEQAGDLLVKHVDVDKISFTGSTPVGKMITRNAAETLKRVTLELGGKSPVIVMPDADMAAASGGVANGIFFNHGQVCVAGSRLYAHRSVFDQLVEAVSESARNFNLGPSLAGETTMGPLVSGVQRDRVMKYIESGRNAGATVIAGGEAPSQQGYFVEPTVLVDVKPDMRVVREEIFGPVLVAQRFDDASEVLAAANDTPYGLAATIWTRDLATMHRMAIDLRAGSVWGNCHGIVDANLPLAASNSRVWAERAAGKVSRPIRSLRQSPLLSRPLERLRGSFAAE